MTNYTIENEIQSDLRLFAASIKDDMLNVENLSNLSNNLSNSPTNANNNSVNYGSNNEMKRSSNSNDLRVKAPNYLPESGSKMAKIINEIEQVKDTVKR